MENFPIPPLYQNPRPRMTYGEKIVRLGLLCGVLMIGALAIWIMVFSREETNRKVSREISDEWDGEVNIFGPLIYDETDSIPNVYPESLNCHIAVESKSLHRNIYEAEVYSAHVNISGSFSNVPAPALSDSVIIKLDTEPEQILMISSLKLNGKDIAWQVTEGAIYAPVTAEDLSGNVVFSTEFDVRGSSSLSVKPIGKRSSITVEGSARNPSFGGGLLPADRMVSDNEFSAHWLKTLSNHDDVSGWIIVKFLVGVSSYQKVSRSMKYAFLIILLTFTSVLFTEIITKQTIPLTNYFLIGAALILFYSLLLSFSEHLSFGISYLIAASMTVALITGYMWSMLRSAKVGLCMCGILTALYGSCFVLLSLATYALLLGSMILFVALAAMMYGSLHLKQ